MKSFEVRVASVITALLLGSNSGVAAPVAQIKTPSSAVLPVAGGMARPIEIPFRLPEIPRPPETVRPREPSSPSPTDREELTDIYKKDSTPPAAKSVDSELQSKGKGPDTLEHTDTTHDDQGKNPCPETSNKSLPCETEK